MKRDAWTTNYTLAPYLVSVEGPSVKLALLITILYEDAMLPRNDWSAAHTAANRPEFVEQLRAAGQEHRRLGLAAHTSAAVDAIRRAADRLNLRFEQITLPKRPRKQDPKEET